MKKDKLISKLMLLTVILLLSSNLFSQDPDFHIYLCFGQSNMEGQGTIEAKDKTVDARFQVLEAVNCGNLKRQKGNWYAATPPLTRCYSGLSPADYFGRTMVASLPENVKIGIINVSVAGCKIELFDEDKYESYAATAESWMKSIIDEYGGNPYAHLVEVAQLAQKDGVIKGILLHQGESNTGDQQWPAKVKKVYDKLMTNLALNPDSVPLLAGEVVHADQGGVCASMNSIIAKLPKTITNSYAISSSGCTAAGDKLHFNSAGYRELGKRYAAQMLTILGYEMIDPEETNVPEEPAKIESLCFEPECESIGENWDIIDDKTASNGQYVTVKAGIQSLTEAAGSEGAITIPFTTSTNSTYYVYGLMNCPTADDDSYWVSIDGGAYTSCNGLATSGWQWMQLINVPLTAGKHTLVVTYREDGAKLDKICISNSADAPSGLGNDAKNICNADTTTTGFEYIQTIKGYSVKQNYPNPFADKTIISFEIPKPTYVSLMIYDIRGTEIAQLAGKEFSQGKHSVEFDAKKLTQGHYFYTIKSGQFTMSRRMVLQAE